MLRHVLSECGVATACSCRDLFSLKLTSRQLIDVATFWSLQLLSRQPGVVATSSLYNCCLDILMLSRPQVLAMDVATTRCCRDLIFYGIVVAITFSFYADVATASDAGLMPRLHPDVATSCLLSLQFLVAYL